MRTNTDGEVNVAAVDQLKAAGDDLSKQVPALVKLGEWYLKKAKATSNAADFTKADALYNAALVRSKIINNETDEDQILQKIVEIYCEFLVAFARGDQKFDREEIRNEIYSHKEFLVNERKIFRDRVSESVSFLNKEDENKDAEQVTDKYESHFIIILICRNCKFLWVFGSGIGPQTLLIFSLLFSVRC